MNRSSDTAYGGVSYVIFFATFLYAIGFVGNMIVPKSLDSPAIDPWPMALAVDLALLSLFAVQHSVMARPAFKRLLDFDLFGLRQTWRAYRGPARGAGPGARAPGVRGYRRQVPMLVPAWRRRAAAPSSPRAPRVAREA